MVAARAAIRALARNGGPGAVRFLKAIATGLPPLPVEAAKPAEEHLAGADRDERIALAVG